MSKAHIQTPAEYLAAEFVVTYIASRRAVEVHHTDCPRWRNRVHDRAHVAALRNGAGIAPCCKDHEARLRNLGARAGAW